MTGFSMDRLRRRGWSRRLILFRAMGGGGSREPSRSGLAEIGSLRHARLRGLVDEGFRNGRLYGRVQRNRGGVGGGRRRRPSRGGPAMREGGGGGGGPWPSVPPPAPPNRPARPPPACAKPLSNSAAASAVRSLADGEPSTTVMRRRPPCVALATTLNPAAQVKPVFMPSAPG